MQNELGSIVNQFQSLDKKIQPKEPIFNKFKNYYEANPEEATIQSNVNKNQRVKDQTQFRAERRVDKQVEDIFQEFSQQDLQEIQTMKIYFSIADKFKGLKTAEERKKLFKELILEYHPDKRHHLNPNIEDEKADVMFLFLKENKAKLIANEQILELDLKDLRLLENDKNNLVSLNTGKVSKKLAKNMVESKYNNFNLLNNNLAKNS